MSSVDRVRRLLRLWALLRIGYGLGAILAPKALLAVLRVKPEPDTRGFNAFLGSRDIVIGAVSLCAKDVPAVRAAVTLNQGCEIVDSVVLAQEVRAGRRVDLFSVAGLAFNLLGWVTWLRARQLLRNG
ncbi:MAG: hypothetical protein ACT4QG_06780 [Sporichthyaceae bacterium]